MDPFTLIGGGISIASSIFSAMSANKQRIDAENKADVARKEMNRLKTQYANLDTSNPFLNLENTMEDLTINQKQAEFERDTFQQSQANILDSMRGATGSSGIAALAQSLAQQGQIAAQKSAASIGQQERANQMAKLQEASKIQTMERQGDIMQRQAEGEKLKTMMGMTAADVEREASAQKVHQAAGYQAMDEFAQAGLTGAEAYISA